MTYIELFNEAAAENICTSLVNVPDRVILVGDNQKEMNDHIGRYKAVLAARGHEVEFDCRGINKNNLSNIVEELSALVDRYDDCVFDLTGGEDLYLVAVGIVAERYKDRRLQMHRFNFNTGKIIDCDKDGVTISKESPCQMSVEEEIGIYGGAVIYDTVRPDATHLWDMSQEFCRDVLEMWDICKTDAHLWNLQMRVLQEANDLLKLPGDALTLSVPVSALTVALKRHKGKFLFVRGLIDALYQKGFITDYFYDEADLSVSFKNVQVKHCLTKGGQVLELLIYMAVLDAREDSGEAVYNDAMSGVCIDWDGEIGTGKNTFDTVNEIDVMMMHGMIPVFVSCKNGEVSMDELYKLNIVAEKFGGPYARRVLVATELNTKNNADDYLRQRAKDMGIRVLDGIRWVSQAHIKDKVRSFWKKP